MENISLLFIFWYGVLHAFGPDHLTAIADFSIGKNQKKTIIITILFALGHGLSLFIFAKVLEHYNITEYIMGMGDIISGMVILIIGMYLLFMVYTNRINLNKHIHNNEEHVHIYFGKKHYHKKNNYASSFTIGILMGFSGVRGMLVTLSLLESSSVDYTLILVFTLGVILVFMSFGYFILYINKNLLKSLKNVRRAFIITGLISVGVASNILFA